MPGAKLDKGLALSGRLLRAQPTLLSNRLVSLIFCFTERFLSLPDMLRWQTSHTWIYTCLAPIAAPPKITLH